MSRAKKRRATKRSLGRETQFAVSPEALEAMSEAQDKIEQGYQTQLDEERLAYTLVRDPD